ncbi:GNAT family N-acetyltransferase [Ornithinimicrobium avium]|uniref:N-acetyltransferase n=1 Tax=Ornithinimicrobium avium TaxID=2283195 RepID=A0A345NP58_9MICO|nr:GNAT family N-acetyltransferase [Ornithinimicrobium avium]AXH96816.1 N-acetyltransferase [Ornithinimicrobium avium]
METSVSRRTGPDRFEISVDGAAAGFTLFVDHEGRRIFYHTEVDPEHGGRGLAGEVVGTALQRTVDEGMRVVAVCPYVKKYVNTHEEFAGHVDAATPQMLRAIPRQG